MHNWSELLEYYTIVAVKQAHVYSLRVDRLVPGRVEVSNARRDIRSDAVFGFEVDWVLVDSIVDPVDRLNELSVQLQPEGFDLGVILAELKVVADDLLTKVPAELSVLQVVRTT